MSKGEVLIVLVIVLLLTYFNTFWTERHSLDKIREASATERMSELTSSIEAYYNEYHTPLGQDNSTLIRMLRGENNKQIVFFATNPRLFNERGELLDSWETPYQIEYHGKTNVTIISAGPNGHFDDEDDLTMMNGELKMSGN